MVLPVLGLLAGAAAMAGGGMYASRKVGDRMDLAQTERERDALGARMGGALDAAGRPQGNTGSMWDVGASLARSGMEENLAPFFAQETQAIGHQQALSQIGARGAETRRSQANAHALTIERMRLGSELEEAQRRTIQGEKLAAAEAVMGNVFMPADATIAAAEEVTTILKDQAVTDWRKDAVAAGVIDPMEQEPAINIERFTDAKELTGQIRQADAALETLDRGVQFMDNYNGLEEQFRRTERLAMAADFKTTVIPFIMQDMAGGGVMTESDLEWANGVASGEIDLWGDVEQRAQYESVMDRATQAGVNTRSIFGASNLRGMEGQFGLGPQYERQSPRGSPTAVSEEAMQGATPTTVGDALSSIREGF